MGITGAEQTSQEFVLELLDKRDLTAERARTLVNGTDLFIDDPIGKAEFHDIVFGLGRSEAAPDVFSALVEILDTDDRRLSSENKGRLAEALGITEWRSALTERGIGPRNTAKKDLRGRILAAHRNLHDILLSDDRGEPLEISYVAEETGLTETQIKRAAHHKNMTGGQTSFTQERSRDAIIDAARRTPRLTPHCDRIIELVHLIKDLNNMNKGRGG